MSCTWLCLMSGCWTCTSFLDAVMMGTKYSIYVQPPAPVCIWSLASAKLLLLLPLNRYVTCDLLNYDKLIKSFLSNQMFSIISISGGLQSFILVWPNPIIMQITVFNTITQFLMLSFYVECRKNGLPQDCQLHRVVKDFLLVFYHTLVLQPSVLFASTELD
jgi:hypothetical protein